MSYCLVACHKLYCVVSEIRLGPSQKQDFNSQQVEWCPNENWKKTKPSEKIYQTFGPVSFKSYQTDRILTRHCLLDWHKVALCIIYYLENTPIRAPVTPILFGLRTFGRHIAAPVTDKNSV